MGPVAYQEIIKWVGHNFGKTNLFIFFFGKTNLKLNEKQENSRGVRGHAPPENF